MDQEGNVFLVADVTVDEFLMYLSLRRLKIVRHLPLQMFLRATPTV